MVRENGSGFTGVDNALDVDPTAESGPDGEPRRETRPQRLFT